MKHRNKKHSLSRPDIVVSVPIMLNLRFGDLKFSVGADFSYLIINKTEPFVKRFFKIPLFLFRNH